MLIWAFARDRGLPLWWIWSKVDKRTRMPLFTVWLSRARQLSAARQELTARCNAG